MKIHSLLFSLLIERPSYVRQCWWYLCKNFALKISSGYGNSDEKLVFGTHAVTRL